MHNLFSNKLTLAVLMLMIGLLGGYFLRIFVVNSAPITQDMFPASCTVNNQTYKSGDPVPSGDSCNSCGCTNGEVSCTTMACEGQPIENNNGATNDEPLSGGHCIHNGITYNIGDSFPSEDGCNSCGCSEAGINCTMKACAPN